MRTETQGDSERLQLDTEGQVIGTLTKLDGHMKLTLEDGFVLIKHESTGRLSVWDRKNKRVVELAK